MTITQDMIDMANKLIFALRGRAQTSKITGGIKGEKPTQGDKPSPASHWTLQAAINKANRVFPRKDGYMIITLANTNSMEPLLDSNSVIVAEYFGNSTGRKFKEVQLLDVGDICVYEGDKMFWPEGTKIIHEIMSVRTNGGDREYLFKGYNNFLPDPGWVKEDKIIARYMLAWNTMRRTKGD